MKKFRFQAHLQQTMNSSLLLSLALISGAILTYTLFLLLGGRNPPVSPEAAEADASASSLPTATQATDQSTYEIVTLIPPDTILAIDEPQFVSGAEADAQYHDEELVIGIVINDDARAYSIPFLSRHEIVNDVVGGKPVAVTW